MRKLTIQENLKRAIEKLKQNNIENPIQKAKRILVYITNTSKQYILINETENLNKDLEEKYEKAINDLCNNVPIQYITKQQEFMSNLFFVNENVLIPRADTEILVEEVMLLLKENAKVLDMCTGSGAIAISLAKLNGDIEVCATDISKEALKVAQINAQNIGVSERITFIHSDMFSKINSKFDVIVSNPPYIETSTINTLDEEVKQEPRIALDGGEDGLKFYKILAKEAYKYLSDNGYLCLEIGYNQKETVSKLLEENYEKIKCIKDLSGNNRVIICKKKG